MGESTFPHSRVIVLFTYILRANSLNDILSNGIGIKPLNIQGVLARGEPFGSRVAQVLIKAVDSPGEPGEELFLNAVFQ